MMTRKTSTNARRLMELFDLGAREARRTELLFTEVTLREGDVIARQDGAANQLLVLLDAEAEVIKDGELVGHINAGGTSGEVSMTGRSKLMTADVIVTKPGRALAAGRGDVARMNRRGKFLTVLGEQADRVLLKG